MVQNKASGNVASNEAVDLICAFGVTLQKFVTGQPGAHVNCFSGLGALEGHAKNHLFWSPAQAKNSANKAVLAPVLLDSSAFCHALSNSGSAGLRF